MQGKNASPLLKRVLDRAVACLLLLEFGCGGATSPGPGGPPVAAQATEPPAALPMTHLSRHSESTVRATNLPIEIALPEARAWQRSEWPHHAEWRHAETNTRVQVRFWASSRLVTLDQCVEELERQSPNSFARRQTRATSPRVIERAFEPADDYRGSLLAQVESSSSGELVGWVQAVAAGIGHCLSFEAKTTITSAQAKGVKPEDARAEVAERLVILVDGVAAKVRLRKAGEDLGTMREPFAPRH